MLEMHDWTVVRSKSGHNEIEIPIGQILVRHPNDVELVIKERNIKDPVIEKYVDVWKR